MPVTTQCNLLGLSRSSVYYRPRGVSEGDLLLMRRIDELHLEHPFLGARKLARLLKDEGYAVGRRHGGTLVRRMGIEAIYRKPRRIASTSTCSLAWPSSGQPSVGLRYQCAAASGVGDERTSKQYNNVTSRDRPAGAGRKPPRAAGVKSAGRERRGKGAERLAVRCRRGWCSTSLPRG